MSSEYTYETVHSDGRFCLLRRSDGRWTVVALSSDGHQVYDAMPGDKPPGGGKWAAPCTSGGIGYVSNGYSESYARQVYRRLLKLEEEFNHPGTYPGLRWGKL